MEPEQSPYNDPENSLNVLEFIRVALEFCLFAEKIEQKDREEASEFFLKIGPLLYIKGKLLPEIEPEYPEASERYVTEEEWQGIFNLFRALFGDKDEFYHVNYEEAAEFEAVKASLSENFADIYQDLKDFILLYQKNSQAARQNAIYDCKALFASRWGHKMLSNLRYLHYLQSQTNRVEADDY